MSKFQLGSVNLKIDFDQCEVEFDDEEMISIEIKTDSNEWDEITEPEDSVFNWALYPPHFYLRGAKYDKIEEYREDEEVPKKVTITKDNMYEEEVSIYLMEHGDLTGNFSIKDGYFKGSGKVDLYGENYDFKIELKIKKANKT